MIVVEGPDGAGKTTLINYLLENTGNLEVAPRVVSKDAEALVDLRQWVHTNLRVGKQRMIFDRHRLISEPIYGPILRKKLEPGFSDANWFAPALEKFYSIDPLVIYCLPPLKTVWSNVQDDEDNKVVAQQHVLQQVWGAYFNKAMTEGSLRGNCWMYDYTEVFEARQRELILAAVHKYLVGVR